MSRLLRDDAGATAIEYALVASLISVAILTAVGSIGSHLNSTFSGIASSL